MTNRPSGAKSPSGSQRIPLIAGNWKMHKTNAEAVAFLEEFLPGAGGRPDVEVAICAPFTALRTVAERTAGGPVMAAAQNMHEASSGAFTGEVSAPMLVELGVEAVVLGHSERRELFGETEEEREAGEMERKLRHQVQLDLAEVGAEDLPRVVVAYEPIWAIGTGNTATPDQAQEAIGFVRALLGDRSQEAAARTRVLYGGSVNPGNAEELLGQPDIDGALVGGASLDPGDFTEIVAAAPR